MAQIDDPDVASAIDSEIKLFDCAGASRDGKQRSQLRHQIAELKEQIRALAAQQEAKQTEIQLIQRELEGVRDLYKKNLVQLSRLTAARTRGGAP